LKNKENQTTNDATSS